jgi:hypothetical protein
MPKPPFFFGLQTICQEAKEQHFPSPSSNFFTHKLFHYPRHSGATDEGMPIAEWALDIRLPGF